MSPSPKKRKVVTNKSDMAKEHNYECPSNASTSKPSLVEQMRQNLDKFHTANPAPNHRPFLRVIITKTGEGIQLGQPDQVPVNAIPGHEWGQSSTYQPSSLYQEPSTLLKEDGDLSHRDFLTEVLSPRTPRASNDQNIEEVSHQEEVTATTTVIEVPEEYNTIRTYSQATPVIPVRPQVLVQRIKTPKKTKS